MTSKRLRLFSFVILALLCGGLALHAQPANRAVKMVKFRILSWSTVINDFNFESNHATTEVGPIVPNTRTRYLNYTGGDDLLFYNTPKPKEGKDERVPVLRVPYAELSENILILINDTAQPYAARVLEESSQKFPPGSYRFINFTPLLMKVAVGTEIGDLSRNGDYIMKPASLKSGDVFTMRIAAEVEKNAAKMIYSNRWMYGDVERIMIFVSQGSAMQNGGLIVKCFTEDVPVAAQSGAQPSNTKPGRPQ